MTDKTTGAPSVAEAVASAEHVEETVVERLERLAGLSSRDYEGLRREEAETLGWRATTLDKEVAALRARAEQDNDLGLFEPEPWPEPIDGAALLDEITAGICQYVTLPEYAAEAIALWAIHTYAFEVWQHSPRLGVTAPEKGCGKSTLLDVLACLVPRAVKTENLTTAPAFRLIDRHKPVLLVDEFDTFLTGRNGNEELRGVLNAGHLKGGRVLRCEGDQNDLRAFKTFGPAALAGIGNLPATIADRSISIFMQRREPGEVVTGFRADRADHLREAASKAARWVADNLDALKASDPVLPPGVFNRLADNWRVLISIADVAGGKWPKVARTACMVLGLKNANDALSIREQLLSDVRGIFQDTGTLALPSKEVCNRLHDIEGQPWSEYGRQNKPITANQMARLLKPLGIRPRTIRPHDGGPTVKGYHRKDFEKAFAAYLPPDETSHRHSGSFPGVTAGSEPSRAISDVTDRNRPKAAKKLDCDGVTVRNGGCAPSRSFEVEGDPEERAAVVEFDGEGQSA